MSNRVTYAQQVNHHIFLSGSLDNGHAIGDGVDPPGLNSDRRSWLTGERVSPQAHFASTVRQSKKSGAYLTPSLVKRIGLPNSVSCDATSG
jgi:hypothetical protein